MMTPGSTEVPPVHFTPRCLPAESFVLLVPPAVRFVAQRWVPGRLDVASVGAMADCPCLDGEESDEREFEAPFGRKDRRDKDRFAVPTVTDDRDTDEITRLGVLPSTERAILLFEVAILSRHIEIVRQLSKSAFFGTSSHLSLTRSQMVSAPAFHLQPPEDCDANTSSGLCGRVEPLKLACSTSRFLEPPGRPFCPRPSDALRAIKNPQHARNTHSERVDPVGLLLARHRSRSTI